MVKIEIEVQVIFWVTVDMIPIDLVLDVVVPMGHQVAVMVAPLMILLEVVQIVPLLNLEDSIGMSDILKSMINLNKV